MEDIHGLVDFIRECTRSYYNHPSQCLALWTYGYSKTAFRRTSVRCIKCIEIIMEVVTIWTCKSPVNNKRAPSHGTTAITWSNMSLRWTNAVCLLVYRFIERNKKKGQTSCLCSHVWRIMLMLIDHEEPGDSRTWMHHTYFEPGQNNLSFQGVDPRLVLLIQYPTKCELYSQCFLLFLSWVMTRKEFLQESLSDI